jgi:outer membrane lipoprotein SlyB
MQITKIILAVALITFLFGACTQSRSSKVYTEDQALQGESVESGIIENVEKVTLRKDGTIVGTAGGSVIGGIAGSTIGGGRGSSIAATIGVIIGGVLGSWLETAITDREALKLIIKLDSGEKLAIVQEADVLFRPGERINVLTSRQDYTKRVSKITH